MYLCGIRQLKCSPFFGFNLALNSLDSSNTFFLRLVKKILYQTLHPVKVTSSICTITTFQTFSLAVVSHKNTSNCLLIKLTKYIIRNKYIANTTKYSKITNCMFHVPQFLKSETNSKPWATVLIASAQNLLSIFFAYSMLRQNSTRCQLFLSATPFCYGILAHVYQWRI